MGLMVKATAAAVILTMIAAFAGGCGSIKSEMIVGTDIKIEDITEFYYTDSATTNPPRFQRYYFHVEDGIYLFTHEKREGENVFSSDDSITVTGTLELGEEEWTELFGFLSGGTVTKRGENTNTGAAKAMFLYWNGDKGERQEFSFNSSEKRAAFEAFCIELKERQMSQK